jgi:hypothetical protein
MYLMRTAMWITISSLMIYGFKSAVQVVTRLLLPLKAYLHKLGIRFSIYVDDGRCVAATLQISLDLCIPQKDLTKTPSQISFI